MRLTTSEIQRIGAAQAVLLSPLDHGTREAWWLASMRSVKAATGCDIATLVLASPTEVAGASEDFDEALFDVFRRFDEDDLDYMRAHMGLVAAGKPVFVASRALREYSGRRMEDTRIFQEFMTPAGVRDGPGMVTPLAGCHAILSVAHSERRRARGEFRHERQMLALLLPCFTAGMRLMSAIREADSAAETALDRAGVAYVSMDADRNEVARSRRFMELLDAEPDKLTLLEAVSAMLARAPEDVSRSPSIRVQTSSAAYEMTVAFSSCSVVTRPVTIVCVRPVGTVLPNVPQLRAARGLSQREAEVALMLARGASNKMIGRALGLRPATVRTHLERIFVKLGIHSRKALALSLIGCEPRPEGGNGHPPAADRATLHD